jgi:uncharacterized protein YqhQ
MTSTQKDSATPARPYIGGQAVLEGVMMRAPTSFAVVVRKRDGSLVVRERPVTDEKKGVRRFPLVRGIVSLVESLRLGGEALRFSAEQMTADLEAEEREQRKARTSSVTNLLSVAAALGMFLFAMATTDASGPSPSGDGGAGDGGEKSGGRSVQLVMLVVAVGFLVALPQAASAGLNRLLHLGLEVQSPRFQLLTGAFKLTIVVGYLLLIRRMADIRRVFQYHGAEHKTISAYEDGLELTVENARSKTTLHPRCGTTFLVMVVLVSIAVFTAVGGLLPRIHTGNALLDNVAFFFEKLPFLPLLVAVTFEIQRLFARYCTTGPLRALLWPGFLVQKVTTIEPSDDQLEVALASLSATLFRERKLGVDGGDVTFESYDSILRAERLRPAA